MRPTDDPLETMRHLYIEGVQEALQARGFKLAVRITSPYNQGPVASVQLLDGIRRGPFVARLASELLAAGLTDEGTNRVMAALRFPSRSFLSPIRVLRIPKGVAERDAFMTIDQAIRGDLDAWASSSETPGGFGAWLSLYDPPADEVVASVLCSAFKFLARHSDEFAEMQNATRREGALAVVDRLSSRTQASIDALREIHSGEVGVQAYRLATSATKLLPVLAQFRAWYRGGRSQVDWTAAVDGYARWLADFRVVAYEVAPILEELGFDCE